MDIVAWLTDLGLERYAEQFAANEIDEKTLRDLSGEDLKELGVSALGHRKKLLLAIAELGKFNSEAGPPLPQLLWTAPVVKLLCFSLIFQALPNFPANSARKRPMIY